MSMAERAWILDLDKGTMGSSVDALLVFGTTIDSNSFFSVPGLLSYLLVRYAGRIAEEKNEPWRWRPEREIGVSRWCNHFQN